MDNWTAKDWLSRLPPGCAGLLVEDTVVYRQPMNMVLTSTPDGETLIIARNSGVVTTIQMRRRRKFLIECLFRALTSERGQLKGAHTALRDHVARWLCLLTLIYTGCVLVRITLDGLQKTMVARHGAW